MQHSKFQFCFALLFFLTGFSFRGFSQEVNTITLRGWAGSYPALSTVVFFKNSNSALSKRNKHNLDLLIEKIGHSDSLIICINKSKFNGNVTNDPAYLLRQRSIIDYLLEHGVPLKTIDTNANDVLFKLMDSSDKEKNSFATQNNNDFFFYFQAYLLEKKGYSIMKFGFTENSTVPAASFEPVDEIDRPFAAERKRRKAMKKSWKRDAHSAGNKWDYVAYRGWEKDMKREKKEGREWNGNDMIARPERSDWAYSRRKEKKVKERSTVTVDTDGDGVPDAEDRCPTVPGAPSNNGCPLPPPPRVEKSKIAGTSKPRSSKREHTDAASETASRTIAPSRSPASETKATTVGADHKNETTEKPAKVAYIYPQKLRKGQYKTISVRASINNSASEAKNAVKMIEVSSDSAGVADGVYNIDVVGIDIYDSLTVTIDDPSGDFDIKPDAGYVATQKITKQRAGVWQWDIGTKSTRTEGALNIHVIPSPSNLPPLPVKTVKIKILFDTPVNYVRSYVAYVLEASVLVGIIAYFGKRILERKKKDSDKPSE